MMQANDMPGGTLSRRRFVALSAATAGVAGAAGKATPASASGPQQETGDSLSSGDYQLSVATAASEPAVLVRERATGEAVLTSGEPLQLIVKNGDLPADFQGRYDRVVRSGDSLIASGRVTTTYGSEFGFEDVYSAISDSGVFQVGRTVTALAANPALDLGFTSRFALGPATSQPLEHYQFLAPGVWYDRNENVPGGALAGDYSDNYFYFREMRLPLPFIMMYDPDARTSFTIAHTDPHPRSERDERSGIWWIDPTITFASLGAHKEPSTQLAILMPGMEGERNYVNRGADWVRRSHPVEAGFSHTYTVRINIGSADRFPDAVHDTWRHYYDLFSPPVAKIPAQNVYSAAVDLLAHHAEPNNGIPGIPFRMRLPGGEVDAVSLQMGFVGQQLPAAHLLLRHGLNTNKKDYIRKGTEILDFWANEASQPSGLPKIWHNVVPPTWRDFYPIYLRIATDGMEGVLRACELVRDRRRPNALWEGFAVAFGDWLLGNQNDDGSYYRSYNEDGTEPDNTAKYNTHNAVPFLLGLADYTGDDRYREAAVRAGEFAHRTVHTPARYVGGTPDNDNVVDKEASALALRSFLRLFQAIDDEKWLAAARRAADFTETWAYAWTYPVDTERIAYAKYGLRGQSLIATGHSGMDTWLSQSVFDYYQLHRHTNDAHYLHFARLLANETKLTTQWAGNNLKYERDGLGEEAISLVDLSYGGVNVWLPWIGVAQAEPLADLEDTYGDMDIDKIK